MLKMTQNILLTGFKASGKSSAGRVLARRLGARFVDTDAVIERLYRERYGKALTCREVYAAHGAEVMRDLETEALREAAGLTGAVIATGGGAVLRPENRRLLKEAGICVFLDTPLPELEKRLKKHAASPLFRGKGAAQLHQERYSLYTDAADLRIVPESGETPDKTAERVLQGVTAILKEKSDG